MYHTLSPQKYHNILAHTKKGEKDETLIEHSELTKVYLEKILDKKNLDDIIDQLIQKIDSKNQKLIKKLFLNAVYLHDMGKINPYFQAKKMKNPNFKDYQNKTDSSNHSLESATMYIDMFKEEIDLIEEDKVYFRLIFILYNFAYQISKHHGRLSNIEGFLKKSVHFANAKKDVQQYLDSSFEFYILNKLLFSLIISSDYYATGNYMTGQSNDDFGLFSSDEIFELKKKFEEYSIVKDIRAFDFQGGDINKLRSEMFLEAERNMLQNIKKNIFYLEAPTGSGKTLTSINLALTLLSKDEKLNKLFYIFPFNTLVEQTKKQFDKIFGDDFDIALINSITPIKEEKDDEGIDYGKSYINRLFFHSKTVITTHVSLFNILFGTSRDDNYPLWQLANSVIIIDEIQSYNNQLWWYMITFFEKYASLLNIKIIIMSATLPKLDTLLDKQSDSFVELMRDRAYFFENTLFKDRVNVDYSLLGDGKITLDRLHECIKKQKNNYNKILFEFIKKQSARDFYELIKDDSDFEVYELSGDDNKAQRQFVIDRTEKKDIKIIIVATQVIEAGVDIDMDLGFKNISTIDGEEQFMGRINRSCKKLQLNPKVYFFEFDEVSDIYKDDHRVPFTLKDEKFQMILANKDYKTFYKDVLDSIKNKGQKFDKGVITNYDTFLKHVTSLNYEEINKTMTLINSQSFTLYFPFSIDIGRYKIEEFKKIDSSFLSNGCLDGKKVWEAFVALQDVDNFVEKEVKKSQINSLMQFFTFNIIKFSDSKQPHYYSDEVGGFYLISDWEPFIKDGGKFDRVAYQKKTNNIFL